MLNPTVELGRSQLESSYCNLQSYITLLTVCIMSMTRLLLRCTVKYCNLLVQNSYRTATCSKYVKDKLSEINYWEMCASWWSFSCTLQNSHFVHVCCKICTTYTHTGLVWSACMLHMVEPLNEFWRNSVLTLCHWRPPYLVLLHNPVVTAWWT
jgi:hypothetical protein